MDYSRIYVVKPEYDITLACLADNKEDAIVKFTKWDDCGDDPWAADDIYTLDEYLEDILID